MIKDIKTGKDYVLPKFMEQAMTGALPRLPDEMMDMIREQTKIEGEKRDAFDKDFISLLHKYDMVGKEPRSSVNHIVSAVNEMCYELKNIHEYYLDKSDEYHGIPKS